jgi:hypothetical protein
MSFHELLTPAATIFSPYCFPGEGWTGYDGRSESLMVGSGGGEAIMMIERNAEA